MEKICRYCKYFTYHRFAGYCTKKAIDTCQCYGNCEACKEFIKQNDEEKKAVDDYEKDTLVPFLNQIKQ